MKIAKYESGLINISWDVVKEMHRVYNLPFDWFATGTGSKFASEGKRTLTTDMSELNTTIQFLESKVKNMESIVELKSVTANAITITKIAITK